MGKVFTMYLYIYISIYKWWNSSEQVWLHHPKGQQTPSDKRIQKGEKRLFQPKEKLQCAYFCLMSFICIIYTYIYIYVYIYTYIY